MYALVDANSFYCSAEQVFRPEWRGKPIVVLSNNDGCVVAANRQAKELGIPKFKPFFQVKDLCEKRGVITLSSNYELYADLSAKMMDVIGRFASEQHIYSIDESFLSFHRSYPAIPCLTEHGTKLRRAVWKECRLPVCVGIAPTLTLAKIANHAAKKLANYKGVCLIGSEKERTAILAKLDVGDVWGIGKRTSSKLRLSGVNTALDLAHYPPALARKEFNVEVQRTILELNAQACISWDTARADKKQIYSTRSVGKRILEIECLRKALSKHAGIASKKARAQQSLCKTMICFAGNSPYDDKPASFRAVHRFSHPTSDVTTITQAVSKMTEQLFREGVRYYKIGVGLIELVDGRNEQPDLFNPTPNNKTLMNVLDCINNKYGSDTVFLAAQGTDEKWKMRREYLTPRYTTSWKDIPKIVC
ncbi:Y-family DNA polymerase [Vibrio sp. HN007]|uniref:Y-family DNA polymerase n=1 Tax=Vibrio iocasae TaxID=3098914 RepID=UPI0035D4583D